MADPGSVPFRRETVLEAQKYMADKIRAFEQQFDGGEKDPDTMKIQSQEQMLK
jgi:hypothetical protein